MIEYHFYKVFHDSTMEYTHSGSYSRPERTKAYRSLLNELHNDSRVKKIGFHSNATAKNDLYLCL